MRLKEWWWSGFVADVRSGLMGRPTAVAAAGEQFLPVLSYSRGCPQWFTGTPVVRWVYRLSESLRPPAAMAVSTACH